MKTLIICIMVLSIAMFSAPVSAENPYIEVYEDPIQEVPWGFIVRPTGDENGYEVLYDYGPYGSETLVETPDTTNLKKAIKDIEPGGTIKLVGGTYYISRVIICRKDLNLFGAGMNHTIIVAKGANSDPFPLTTEKEIAYNNFDFFRGPGVLRFAVPEDADSIKVNCENFTIRTGETEIWYRGGFPPGTPLEVYTSHAAVIGFGGNNQAGTPEVDPDTGLVTHNAIDFNVNRIDAKIKNVRIEGSDSYRPFIAIVYWPALRRIQLDPEGLNIGQLLFVEPANGIVEIEGCKFEKIKTYPICIYGLASLPLPTVPIGYPVDPDKYPLIDWTEPTEQTPAVLKITGCDFVDAGNVPCPVSGWISNILILDSSNANSSITNNTFVDTKGMAAVITGGIVVMYNLLDLPLPLASKYYISNNHMQFTPTGLEFELDGIFLMDLGSLATAGTVKTLDVNISGNMITFNRPPLPLPDFVPKGAVFGLGPVNALFENNDIEGVGLAGIYAEFTIGCSLLKNKVDNFDGLIGAPIWLGPGTSYCTVIGLPGTTVVDDGTNNDLLDVQTASGEDLSQAVKDAISKRIKKYLAK